MHILHVNKEEEVEELNKHIQNGANAFVLVYMDGCGPCNATRPEWAKLESALSSQYKNNDKLVVADVNKNVMAHLKHLGDVDGFPTIKHMHHGGKKVESYESSSIKNKDRSVDSFVNWIETSISVVEPSTSSASDVYKRIKGGRKKRQTRYSRKSRKLYTSRKHGRQVHRKKSRRYRLTQK